MMKMYVAGAVCVLALLLPSIAAQSGGLTWNRVVQNGVSRPAPRNWFAFGHDPLSNSLVVFSGSTTNGTLNDTWIFSIASGTWTELSPTRRPPARLDAYHGVVRVNGESLFVVTLGFLGGAEFGDVWAFRFSTNEWTEIEPSGRGPTPRYGGHFGAAYGDSNVLWVGSGFTGQTPLPIRYIDTYKLVFTNFNTASWEEVFPQPSVGNQFLPFQPHGRCLQTSAVVDDLGLVMAGGCMRGGLGGGPCPTDDTWFFNDTTRSWNELPRCITPRVWSGMASLTNNPGMAVLYGGNDDFSKQLLTVARYPEDEVFVVDVAENEWKRYRINSSEYPARRMRFGMVAAANGQVYMYGGIALSGGQLDDMWLLSGDIDDTVEIPCNNVWFSYAHFHGILMFLAFGLLFPLGVTIAQMCRCKSSKVWFIFHIIVQVSAALLAIAGFIMIFVVAQGAGQIPTHPHAIVGMCLMFFMLIQPINGIFRPHIKEDEDKSTYRVCWEWFHRIYGFFVIALGFAQVTLGVFLIVPPQPVWMAWIVIAGLWIINFIVLNTIRIICKCCCRADDEDYVKTDDQELKNLHP